MQETALLMTADELHPWSKAVMLIVRLGYVLLLVLSMLSIVTSC